MLTDDQLLRYNRQIMLPALDVAGQEKLLASCVLVIGAGGLGCPAALYLGAAGVGRLLLADDDVVELSNLQRQVAHRTQDIGRTKVDSLRDAVLALNPQVQVEALPVRLAGATLAAAVARADVVLDATDNAASRFAINRACLAAGKPLVSGAAIRFEGQLAVFDPRRADSPCYRCLYGEADPAAGSCAENGVLSPVVGVIGALQAVEALKLLAGFGEPLTGRLAQYDGLRGQWRAFRIPRDGACPDCGPGGVRQCGEVA